MTTKVTIHRDGVFAGDGRWTDDCEIVDCPAILGDDQDASDATYEALCDALASLPQTEDHWRGPVDVERPDGTYTAELTELVVVADDTYEITEFARAVESKRWARWQLELRDRLLAAGQHDFSTVEFPSDEGGVLVIHGPRGWWVLDPDLEGEAPFFARLLAIESVGTTDELIDHCLAHVFLEERDFWLLDGDYEPVVDEDIGDHILWDSQVAVDRLFEEKA